MKLVLSFLTLAALVFAQEKLLVVHKLADTFGYIDLASGKMETEVPTGVKPHEFALSADSKLAYVTNYGADSYTETQPGGNSITIVDLDARKAAGEIRLGDYHRPHGIERGESGRFYVTTDFPAALLIVNVEKRSVQAAIRIEGKLPHMVQLSHDEKIAWTADAGSGTITSIELAAKKATRSIDVGGVPMGLALSLDGRTLYVATRTNNLVYAIDTASNSVTKKLEVPGQPARLLLTRDGRSLLASLIDGGAVALIVTASFKEARRVPVGARSEGMTLAVDGRSFFISAQGDHRVVQLRLPTLERIRSFETSAKPDPLLVWSGAGKQGAK